MYLSKCRYLSKYNEHSIYIDSHVKNPAIADLYKFSSIITKRNNYNLVISIGGDGAILSCVRRMKTTQIPLFGIHIGNLGFLNNCNKSNYKKYLDKIFKFKKFKYTKHRLIKASFIDDNNKKRLIIALNDIVISQPEIPRLVNLDVYIWNKLLNKFNYNSIVLQFELK